MNLLLIAPEEIQGGVATLQGRRAVHVASVLRKQAGEQVRVGVIDTGTASAGIRSVRSDGQLVTLELGPLVAATAPTTVLILGIPRPKSLSRIVQAAASFGIAHLELVRTARVEPSYLDSPRLHAARLREDLLLGLEQGSLVHVPTCAIRQTLSEFVEQDGQAHHVGDVCAVLHPAAEARMPALCGSARSPVTVRLAIGPDGGWREHEVQLLEQSGFLPITLGTPALRTESAVAAALGQLALARHL